MRSATWGMPLIELKRLDDGALRQLQAVGVFSVDDLLAMCDSDRPAVRNLLGDVDIDSLDGDLRAESRVPPFAGLAGAEPAFYYFGAASPADAVVPETVPHEHVRATAASLEAGPADVPAEAPIDTSVSVAEAMRPIRDQGKRSTCVAHAGVAVLEHAESARGVAPMDLSPQFLYWAAKQRDGYPNTPGTLLATASDALSTVGVCVEQDWPYVPDGVQGNESYAPPPPHAAQSASLHKAASVVPVPRQSAQAMKEHIDAGHPVAFSVTVYASSPDVRVWTNPFGKIPMPFPNTMFIGNHAMCAVGYAPDPTAPGGAHLIVRNSWGTGWASLSPYGPGYGTLPFAYVDDNCIEAVTVI